MLQLLQQNRAKIDREMAEVADRLYFSPIFYAQYKVVPTLIRRYLHGRVIDLGCGTMPFRSCVSAAVSLYHGLDIAPKSAAITLIGDVQNLSMLADASYDSAICLEVLEHLPEPALAVAEMQRILKPGGTLILSVPHISRLHDLPHDYYRFTHLGLRHILEKQGFTILELHTKGGLFTFLGHQISTILVAATWSMPRIKPIIWQLNKWLITLGCYYADKMLDKSGTFAAGYVAVARKPVG